MQINFYVRQRKNFRSDVSGSLSIYIVMLFFTVFSLGGLAFDLIKYESKRSHIQSQLDIATVAAASLRQSETPTNVVNGYLSTAKLDPQVEVRILDEIATASYRRVEVSATKQVSTIFMRAFGVSELDLNIVSAAEERIPNVEISVVIDVSNSMGSGGRLTSLVPALSSFYTNILAANDETNPNRVSISTVPYDMQTNAGKALYEAAYGPAEHQLTFCSEWNDSAWSDTSLSVGDQEQAVHAAYRNSNSNSGVWEIDLPHCSEEEYDQILPFSKDPIALIQQVEAMKSRGSTSLDVAAKWGVALLDPTTRPVITHLSTLWNDEGIATDRQAVDPGFSQRPVDFNHPDTQKVMLIITDGQNVAEHRVKPAYRSDDASNPSHGWYNPGENSVTFTEPSGDSWQQMTWKTLWKKVPLETLLIETGGELGDYWDTIDAATKNTRFSNICTAAKNNGIIIFSIAYGASTEGQQSLRDCSTNEAFFHTALPGDIEEIFGEIGAAVEKLKITR
jgi:hypothetical protein